MSTDELIIGVPSVEILEPDAAEAIQDMTGITPTFAAVAATVRLRSINKPLLATDTYKVILVPIGFDPDGGYTAGIGTVASADQTITVGQVVRWRIDNGDFADLAKCVAVAVTLKTGTSDYYLLGFNLINPTEDLTGAVYFKPSNRNPYFSATVLNDDADTTTVLGPRVGYGYKSESFPTTEGVRLRHKKTLVDVRPDDAPDWSAATNSATDVSFKALLSDPETVVRAIGGNFVQYADSTGDTMYQGHTDLVTSAAVLPGCQPIRFVMPASRLGEQIRMYYGNLDFNVAEVTEDMTKSAQYALDFDLQFSAMDKLLRQMHTGVIQLRQAA